jgi:hypothetical protein
MSSLRAAASSVVDYVIGHKGSDRIILVGKVRHRFWQMIVGVNSLDLFWHLFVFIPGAACLSLKLSLGFANCLPTKSGDIHDSLVCLIRFRLNLGGGQYNLLHSPHHRILPSRFPTIV